MIPSRRFYSLVLILLVAVPASAEIYKWVDPSGETHYSERKPGVETMVETLNPSTGPTVERDTWQMRVEASAERRAEAQKQTARDDEATADANKIKHNCEQANIRVASLERPRVNKVATDGTRTRMSEEWRQEQLTEARAAIEKYCS